MIEPLAWFISASTLSLKICLQEFSSRFDKQMIYAAGGTAGLQSADCWAGETNSMAFNTHTHTDRVPKHADQLTFRKNTAQRLIPPQPQSIVTVHGSCLNCSNDSVAGSVCCRAIISLKSQRTTFLDKYFTTQHQKFTARVFPTTKYRTGLFSTKSDL